MLASARRAVPRVSAALRGLGTFARPHLPSTFALAPPSLPPPHRPAAAPPPLWWPAVGLDEPVLHKLAGAPLPLVEDETTNQLELVMPGGLTGASRPELPRPPGAAVPAASADMPCHSRQHAGLILELPPDESEGAVEEIQAKSKKGWRTYQPSVLRRKRTHGFLK